MSATQRPLTPDPLDELHDAVTETFRGLRILDVLYGLVLSAGLAVLFALFVGVPVALAGFWQ